MTAVLVRGGTLVSAAGPASADLLLEDGRVVRVGGEIAAPPGTEEVAAAGLLVLPGLTDCHVHFRDPGFPQKGTFGTEAAAALAGGVTCVCEMPNTSPPTVTVSALADKVRRSAEVPGCDMRFFFGVTQDAHLSALRTLWEAGSAETERLKARCCGVKLYLDHSTGDQKVEESLVPEVFEACAHLKIPIVAHCEDPATNAAALAANPGPDVAAHSLRRPPEAEVRSVAMAIGLVRKTGAALHVAHLSTAGAAALVAEAKKEGLPVTCEVAPHHLFLTDEDYARLGTLAKMNPPLRSREHRDALWAAVADGTVDCIATDHAPHTLEEKGAQPPLQAPSGVPGVETMLPLLLSVCAGAWPHPSSPPPPGLALSHADVVRLCHDGPNRIFRLGKGGLEAGSASGVVLVDPSAAWTVRGAALRAKCGWTPFEGWTLTGAVVRVLAV